MLTILVVAVFILIVVAGLLFFLNTTSPAKGTPAKKIHRLCPICGSELMMEDTVIAEAPSFTKGSKGPYKVFIHGCKHCYNRPGIKERELKIDVRTN